MDNKNTNVHAFVYILSNIFLKEPNLSRDYFNKKQ